MGKILTTKEFTDALDQIDYCFDGYYRGGVDGIESVVEQIRCHDNALRTQARELAEAVIRNIVVENGCTCKTCKLYQRAQEVLKEGA